MSYKPRTVYNPSGLSGATASSRYVGATAAGAPVSGAFLVGDYIIDRTGQLWMCISAGSPGTWLQAAASENLPSTVMRLQGAWSGTTAYAVGDVVTYNNLFWVAGVAGTGITPAVTSVYAATVLADVPTAYYRLGDAGGSASAADSSGHGHTGNLGGTVTFAQTGLLAFDGDTSAGLSAGGSVGYPVTQSVFSPGNGKVRPCTHELWFKTAATGSDSGLLVAVGVSGFGQSFSGFQALYFSLNLSASGHLYYNWYGTPLAAGPYNDGLPHHLVVTIDLTTVTYYVDGVNIGSNGLDAQGNQVTYDWLYGCGTLLTNGLHAFQGSIDEVAFYDGTSLSASRILAHYTAGHSANPWSVIATNPMTTQGDLITGGSAAQPTRVTAGTSSQVLVGGTTPAFGNVPSTALTSVPAGNLTGNVPSGSLVSVPAANLTGTAPIGTLSSVTTDILTFVLNGSGATIATGVAGDLLVPYACTIVQVTLLADRTTSAVVDIWKDTYANFPPTVAGTITAAALPTISAATKSQDSTLTGWSTAIAAGSILRFNVNSCSAAQLITIALKVTRT